VSLAHGLVIWVPIDGVSEQKLRPPMTGEAIARLTEILRSPAHQLQAASREREQQIKALMRDGSPESLCTIVRDLTAYSEKRTLNAADTAALEKARSLLAGEWEWATGSATVQDDFDKLLREGARLTAAQGEVVENTPSA